MCPGSDPEFIGQTNDLINLMTWSERVFPPKFTAE